MCLVKVRQEEDVVVPYRVVHARSPSPRRRASTTRRISRTEVIRESRPPSATYIAAPRPPSTSYSASYVAVPAPKPLAVPAPQPVPVFVQPPPPPPPPMPVPAAPSHISSHHHHHHSGAHYVEVSPRSSVSSSESSSPSRSEYVMHEREYRRERRDYSPESSPRYEHYRYVDPPPAESDHYERYTRRERSRSRARSRDYGYEDPRGSYRETRERVVVVDGDGRRTREYRR